MGREIERKFLVRNSSWQDRAGPAQIVRQGYLCLDPERTVRVRVIDGQGYLTVKGREVGGGRPEYEYPVPVDEAAQMLEGLCLSPLIDKTRHLVRVADLVWEVDVFRGANQGLVLAEVELTDPAQKVVLPDWVGREVSGDPRYLNASLVKRPYRLWADAPN